MMEPEHYFDQGQARVLSWLLVGAACFAIFGLFSVMAAVLYYEWDNLLREIVPHMVVILGLAGMGMSSVLLVAISRTTEGPIKFEALTVKLEGGAGPVVLWAIAYLSMVIGAKMLW